MNDMTQVENRDGAAVRFPPPLVYLLSILLGVGIHLLLWHLPLALSAPIRWGLAIVFVGAGVGLVASAIGLFKRTGQDPKPWVSTPEIIVEGIYHFTRNPMYVGMALIQIAVGFGAANGWIIALVPVSLVVVYLIAVRHEEAYLEAKFGDSYRDYKASVRRWL